MRPRTLDEVVGQERAIGPGTPLRRLIEQDKLPSVILWGPPGSGKTSLARVLAGTTGAAFESLSAVLSGVKDAREVVERAKRRRQEGRPTLLFVDEVHRFNKAQQDAFLPHVEAGLITLVGATTENPSFSIIGPLLSRCRVVVLEPLSEDALAVLLDRALADEERGLGGRGVSIDEEGRATLIRAAGGDARAMLNVLEAAASVVFDGAVLTGPEIAAAAGRRLLVHDREGDKHYDLASALQKSIRSSDVQAGLYWAVRLLEAGEEPRYVMRRLVVVASEDVGLAAPWVLPIVIAAKEAVEYLGMPEGRYAIVQAVVVLASAPKSNACKAAYAAVAEEIDRSGALPVPLHLRNAPTPLMKQLGYGRGYQYVHDFPGGVVDQEHLPPELLGSVWFRGPVPPFSGTTSAPPGSVPASGTVPVASSEEEDHGSRSVSRPFPEQSP
jgi:putative ATPase